MITPAIKTPRNADIKLLFLSSPKRIAIKHPVHAPLPGRGTATNKRIPK